MLGGGSIKAGIGSSIQSKLPQSISGQMYPFYDRFSFESSRHDVGSVEDRRREPLSLAREGGLSNGNSGALGGKGH